VRRRALLIGINDYDYMEPLSWCVEDALAMRLVLESHEDYTPNFACRTLTSRAAQSLTTGVPSPVERVTFNTLRIALEELFAFDDMVLFYFSGHAYPTEQGVYLVTQDGTESLPGILLNDLLTMANNSSAREVLLLIDSCYSGALGEPDLTGGVTNLYLRSGVTLLASARSDQQALEINGHGLFTGLVIGALKGGASDVRGRVSAASIYAYVEQALGPWDQRPIYKSNATRLSPIRYCIPAIRDDELRALPQLFPQADHHYYLDPSYEVTRPEAIPKHVALFKLFKRYQVARLLRPVLDEDLYFAAIRNHPVELTPLGQFYWYLAKHNLLESPALSSPPHTAYAPDAEAIARLFHEAYERLAPAFGYETREATRRPWEQVPERNKRLMVAATAEVLAMLFPPEPPGSTAPPTSQDS